MSRARCIAIASVFVLAGCTADKVMQTVTKGVGNQAPDAAADAGVASTDAGAPPPPPMPALSDADFQESDRSRDPFRSYMSQVVPLARVPTTQREVLLPQYALDELRLVAIVTGTDVPRAMVVDPDGKGQVLRRGDWVGRAEVVRVGGVNGSDVQLNWRVTKIRDGELVFTREDPAQPGAVPVSRVMALRPEGEAPTRGKR
jgi:type IV pilus assembly protein PilP